MLNIIRLILFAIVLIIICTFSSGLITELYEDWDEMPVCMRAVKLASLFTIGFMVLLFLCMWKVW